MLPLQCTVQLYQQLQGTVILGSVAFARYSTTVPAIARYGTTGVCCSCKVQYYCTSNCKVQYYWGLLQLQGAVVLGCVTVARYSSTRSTALARLSSSLQLLELVHLALVTLTVC